MRRANCDRGAMVLTGPSSSSNSASFRRTFDIVGQHAKQVRGHGFQGGAAGRSWILKVRNARSPVLRFLYAATVSPASSCSQTGSNDVEAVERGFGGDAVVVPAPRERAISRMKCFFILATARSARSPMFFSHAVLRPFCRCRHRRGFRSLQQSFALARSLLRQQRISADHEALPGVEFRDLRHVAFKGRVAGCRLRPRPETHEERWSSPPGFRSSRASVSMPPTSTTRDSLKRRRSFSTCAAKVDESAAFESRRRPHGRTELDLRQRFFCRLGSSQPAGNGNSTSKSGRRAPERRLASRQGDMEF